MQYRFYLDGNPVENPAGWDKMVRKVQRDKELKAVLLNLDADLTFQGDAYAYLRGLFEESYCGIVDIEIHQSRNDGQSFYERYRGSLFVTDMEFDEFKCYAKVKVTDNSYYAYISANRSVETSLLGGKSKNSFDEFNIDPCKVQRMQLFTPSDCTYFSNIEDYGCFTVDDALRYLVEFMSDGKVEYYSPLFGTGGKHQFLAMTYGRAIRMAGVANDGGPSMPEAEFTAKLPKLSFGKLIKELNRFFNIGFTITTAPSGKPRVYVDEWKNFFQQSYSTVFSNLPNLKVSTSGEDIYNQVAFGGPSEEGGAFSFPGDINFVGFKSEKFFTLTTCPVDNMLDLSGDFIVDTNIIEKISVTSVDVASSEFGDTTYDSDWFFIDSTYVLGDDCLQAKQSNWLQSSPPCFYNELFTNFQTSLRWMGFIPASIADYLGTGGNDTFRASTAGFPITAGPTPVWNRTQFEIEAPFPDQDPYNLWDTIPDIVGFHDQSRYLAPASGVYTFHARLFVNPAVFYNYKLKLVRLDNAYTTVLGEVTILDTVSDSSGVIEATGSINANANDYIRLEVIIMDPYPYAFHAETIRSGSFIEVVSSSTGGGRYQIYDPSRYPIVKNTFTMEINKSQTDAIEANPMSLIRFFITPANVKSGFIEDVSIDEFNGTATLVLIQGTGYPAFDACEDELGDELLSNNGFADPNTYWALSGAPIGGAFSYNNPGLMYNNVGSGTDIASVIGFFPGATTSPTGKYKTVLTIEDMTAGECWIDVGGGCVGTHRVTNGNFVENVDCAGALTFSLVYCTWDFDGRVTFASIKPINVACEDDCVEGYGANALPNYRFALGDNGDWEKNPTEAWFVDTSGAVHFSNGDPMTSGSLFTDVIANQTSPTGKWRVTVLVTGRTAGNYQVNAAGYMGAVQFANGTYSEVLDLAADPLDEFRLIVSGDFDGKVILMKAEPLLNECN